MSQFPKIAKLKTPEQFQQRLDELEVELPFDSELESGSTATLGQPVDSRNHQIGNRFCILPMEGWDATKDGKPTDLTRRRWERFGISGAKLIWGGEAVAVRPDGRANPNQLMMNRANRDEITSLRELLIESHRKTFGSTEDLCVGLQLTHSGRFARPNQKRQT